MKRAIIFYLLLFPLAAIAQKDGEVAFKGYHGNFIYNLFQPASPAHPDGEVVGFKLQRRAEGETNWTQLSTFHTPQEYKDLHDNYERAIPAIFDHQPAASYTVNEVWPVYKKTFKFDSLGVYLSQQLMAMSFKLLLADTTAKPGINYQYRVAQVKRDGSEYGAYTSTVVRAGAGLNVTRPIARSRKETGSGFELIWKAKFNGKIPDALLIKQNNDLEPAFRRITPFYTITQEGDSLVYAVTETETAEDRLYQYTITPVNRYGGMGTVVSDTLMAAVLDQKMLLPKAFTVTPDSLKNQMVLNWGFLKPDHIGVVKVFRSDVYEGDYQLIGSGGNQTYVDRTIIPGRKYYYYLMITDRLGRASERSVKAFGLVRLGTKPEQVINIQVTKEGKYNKIVWQDINLDTRGYYVYRLSASGDNPTVLSDFIYRDSSKFEGYTYIDTVSSKGAQTGYAIKTVSLSSVESDLSRVVFIQNSGQKTLPPVITDHSKADKIVFLYWRNGTGATGVTGYNVYRKTGNGNFEKANAAPLLPTATSFKDTVTPGMSLTYKMTALSATGEESDFSDELEIRSRDMVHPPGALTTQITRDSKEIILNWQPSQSKVAKYEVYRFTKGAEPVKIGETKGNIHNFSDTAFTKGEESLHYYVIAVGENGKKSLPSREVFL